MARKTQIQVRRDTAANWTSANPTLAAGEHGFETDTGKFKIGDGATAWAGLAYFQTGAASSPLTTKGDIYGHSTVDARIPVGSNGQLLTADSAQGLGLKWANTAVTPGTYGDATNTAQVTVNQAGLVTAASAVAISGLAGTGLNKLVTVTRASTGALDTGANAIPTGHGTLIVMCWCRTAAAATTEAYTMTVNGDTGANYDDYHWQTSGTTQTSGVQTTGNNWSASGLLIGNTGVANSVSPVIIVFPGYDDTNWNKSGFMFMSVPGSRWAILGMEWRSTAAINQITLDTASHLLTNSKMVVYGTD